MDRPYVVPVRFAVGTQVVQATTGALSVECAFVRCLVPPRPGERIALRLYLARDNPRLARRMNFVVYSLLPGEL